MNKIRFFFLQAIFLVTPLIYAWLYIPGISIDLSRVIKSISPHVSWSGFESVKVSFFLLCTAGALIAHFIYVFLLEKPLNLSHYFMISLGVVFVWTISSLWLNHDVNEYFTFGNSEKRHGWFFYAALFALFFLLRSVSSEERLKLAYMSFAAFVGVMIYSIFQKIGLDPLHSLYETRIDSERIFSTFGNPNYLAGYLLMVLPIFLQFLNDKFKKSFQIQFSVCGVFLVFSILLYLTGSYLAWIICAFFIIVLLLHYLLFEKKYRQHVIIFLGIASFVFLLYIWHTYGREIIEMQKMKGFIARWYLWKTGISAIFHDVGHFLFGYGPDGFLPISENFRHPLLSVYEDPAYRIDRSHNFFIDFALHFGFPMLAMLVLSVGSVFSHLSQGSKISLIMFAVYFSFNIPVLIHYLIIIQILTYPQFYQKNHG